MYVDNKLKIPDISKIEIKKQDVEDTLFINQINENFLSIKSDSLTKKEKIINKKNEPKQDKEKGNFHKKEKAEQIFEKSNTDNKEEKEKKPKNFQKIPDFLPIRDAKHSKIVNNDVSFINHF